ncbi:MAG: flagellar biosynthetic protein FliP [Candidatus Melainabacteria bacterium RIFOXYA12_FULL_32_12]|nr:MAG: flagellar biosynthetic protein FliP [Candidatus Melainabacteria bacterium GWF2_32_7]OGI22987.1 MAG: flagellar biosynthetic protein FliP [Candidatus Melainabacteria bacterium RIFOXYA2_FULL_32_9]OGI31540.1 MAG: flagellar biosynthetic protein FliP [Candidatus Melainabacteria bacterium RIFOXYA12_FULL_32_12]
MINSKKFFTGIIIAISLIFIGTITANAQVSLPSINISMGQANSPTEFSKGLQILIWLTVLTLAPSIIIMTTAFTRIVIVLSLVRQAMGTAQLPPSQVIVSLAMILTFFVMAPTINEINTTAFQPYMNNKITQQAALKIGIEPLRLFMFKQTEEKDLALFVRMAKIPNPKTRVDVPTYVLIPSFIISELKTAFKIGFMIFIPFLIIDIVVASILVSMGMLFLPPPMIAMPFKIILFVLIDGWHLVAQSLVEGFVR